MPSDVSLYGCGHILNGLSMHVRTWSPASPTELHVVRTGLGSHGRGQNSHLSRAETTVPINTKFWKNNYVGWMKRIAKFRSNRFTWAAPYVGEIYSSRFSVLFFITVFFFYFLFRQPAYRPQFATDFDVWWLKRRGLAWGCAFWVSQVLKLTCRGSTSSKTALVGKS